MQRGSFDDIYDTNRMMKPTIDRQRFKLYLWVGFAYSLLWFSSNLSKYPDSFTAAVFNNVWRVIYVIVLNFIFFEYTLPFIRQKRRSVFYNIAAAVPLVFLHIMLYSYGLYLWRLIGIGLHIYTPLTTFRSIEHAVTEQMGYSVGSVVFFGVITHIYDYIKLTQVAQQLRIEKQEAELNYLKSQTNPHFLFNTLNNIYSLARDKSDRAPESILRLSKILRFMLYETAGAYIAIEQEIKIMSDYIALEQLRYDDSLHVNFNHNIEDMRQALPPLLLIPLVENAFKHGVSETRGQPFVDIHLSVKNRQLVFVIKNSADPSAERVVKENIGLSNLRRQLELLFTDYNLSLEQGESAFTATLKINLVSHV